MNEDLAFLFRPPRALGTIDSLPYRNAEILVKRHESVLLDRLDEQRALHRRRFGRQLFAQRFMLAETLCEIAAPWQIDQTPIGRRFISAAAIEAFILTATTTMPPETRSLVANSRVVQMQLGLTSRRRQLDLPGPVASRETATGSPHLECYPNARSSSCGLMPVGRGRGARHGGTPLSSFPSSGFSIVNTKGSPPRQRQKFSMIPTRS